MSVLVDPKLLEEIRELSDTECAKAILLGLTVLIRQGDPEAIREFLESFVNKLRLAEQGRIAVRDEGAN